MSNSGNGQPEYPDSAGYPDGEGTLDEGTGGFEPADDDENAVAAPATPDVDEPLPGSGPEDLDAHGGNLAGADTGSSADAPGTGDGGAQPTGEVPD